MSQGFTRELSLSQDATFTSASDFTVSSSLATQTYINAQIAAIPTPSTGYSIVSKSADYTASSGELVTCDVSGGSITIDLPASPSADDYVAVQIGTNGTSNTVTVDRNGSTINGAAANQTLYVAKDILYFYYSGSTWLMDDSGLIPHISKMVRAASQTGITSGTFTKVQMDTKIFDDANISDVSSGYDFTIKRAGKYRVRAKWRINSTVAGQFTRCAIYKNGSYFDDNSIYAANSGDQLTAEVNVLMNLSVGDTVSMYIQQNIGTVSTLTQNWTRPTISIGEIR